MVRSEAIMIVGNGPSLLGMDRGVLTSMPTFCCNRFVQWEHAWLPTHYACSANAILKGVEPADPPVAHTRYLVSRRHDELVQFGDSWVKCYKKEWHDLLVREVDDSPLPVRGGGTMPHIMAQLAVWLGYRELYFVGIEQDERGGHVFDPDGRNMPYFIPTPDDLFQSWRNLKAFYEPMGVTLRDCTPNGRLNDILGYLPLREVAYAA